LEFLERAQEALGHSIEIISGIEEARLIYLGVAHSLPDPGGRRLVVDIGGGSTELIIGEGFEPRVLESLYMGCVGMSKRFFADGKITKESMHKAMLAARLELQPVKRRYRELGWSLATGSSGTIRAVRDVVANAGWSDNGITPASLHQLRDKLIAAGHVDALRLEGLSDNRRAVFPGGFVVLDAVFDALKIERMLHSNGALREGVIYDLNGRIHHHDKRESTINAITDYYRVDREQADRVEQAALAILDQVREDWKLKKQDACQWLHWAAQLHEIGLTIAHSQYHRHGAYIIRNADLAGFSQRDQRFLSLLVQSHRRKLKPALFEALPDYMRHIALRLAAIIRLAVLLRRSRSGRDVMPARVSATEKKITLQFPPGWLDAHPLTSVDLRREKKYLKSVGMKLRFS
jgi:exopolyphosphatase/guanosine-5'-triphosphate,3'-diphosphate pyrophosphatase